MRAGRIETYVHSDSATLNKAACMVAVVSKSDFAARTKDFVEFAKKAARLAFAAQAKTWTEVGAAFPEIEAERALLAKTLKEPIEIADITLLAL